MEKEFKRMYRTNTYTKEGSFLFYGDQYVVNYEGEIKKQKSLQDIEKLLTTIINKDKPNIKLKESDSVGTFYYDLFLTGLMRENEIDFSKVLEEMKTEFNVPSFYGLYKSYLKNPTQYNQYDRILFVSNVFVKKQYRNQNKELKNFIDFLKKTHNLDDPKTLLIIYCYPMQYNEFLEQFPNIMIGTDENINPTNELLEEHNDYEHSTLKLYSLATKNGFSPLDEENHIFFYKK